MKVLFQNRPDTFEKWGGDTTQMMETKKHLEEYGVHIDINLETNPDLSGYDLVHIFNIQNAKYGVKQVLNAKNKGIPTVLSTIYWDFSYALNSKETHLYSENSLVRKFAKINTNIPHIAAKFLLFNKNMEQKKYMKLMLRNADIILPNSYSELEIIVELTKMPELRQKAFIVPNAISKLKLRTSSNLIEESLCLPEEYILEVARVETWKGQLNLIKALLDYPDIPLVFIGNLKTFYGEECIKLGNKRGNTYFLGEVPHDMIYTYYSKAKVHALPSLRESPGLSSLEAAVCGANCVISIHSPIPEYFGFDAFCCDPLNIKSIKNAVLKAWNSPKDNRLKKKVLENFTWEKASLKTFEAYTHIINDNPRNIKNK